MLAISVRVSPCSALCSPRSVGRVTISCSPSCVTAMSRLMRSESSPLGPFTRTDSGSIETVTPAGTGMGCLPILDISSRLPDLRQDLAADAGSARVVSGHDAVGGGDDGGAHAAEHLGDVLSVDVGAATGARDAPQSGDCRAAVLGVLQADLDQLSGVAVRGGDDRPGVDVALLVKDPCELALELGCGHVDGLVRGVDRVAHSREKVGYGVCHRHLCALSGPVVLKAWSFESRVLLTALQESVEPWIYRLLTAASTRRTWSSRGSDRCGRGREGRCDTPRTSCTPRAGDRSGCNEYMHVF